MIEPVTYLSTTGSSHFSLTYLASCMIVGLIRHSERQCQAWLSAFRGGRAVCCFDLNPCSVGVTTSTKRTRG